MKRPHLQLGVLFILGCMAEGRPRTLKRCGRRDSPSERIIGGFTVQPGEFPWMVSVHEKSGSQFQHICGGAIINEHYIITAAHCIDYATKPKMYEIYTGVHLLSKKNRKPAKKYKVSQVIMHKDYDPVTFVNDIALLRTKEPIQIEGTYGYVNGICLPYSHHDPTGWGTVTGWGYTEENGETSDILRAVKVPLIGRKQCSKIYDQNPDDASDDILESQICAGIVNRDSCQNDSGGPLMQKNKRGIYTLIGVVSYGVGCGQQDYPGIYTKVSSYMDWLEEKME